MKCSKCNNELNIRDKFCTKCGTAINTENSEFKTSINIESKLKKFIKTHNRFIKLLIIIIFVIIIGTLSKKVIYKIKLSNEVDDYVEWVESQDYSKYKTLDIKILDTIETDFSKENPIKIFQSFITYYQYWIDECNSRILYLSELKDKIEISNSVYQEIEKKIECVKLMKELDQEILETYNNLKQIYIDYEKDNISDEELSNKRAELDEEFFNAMDYYQSVSKEKNWHYSTYELMQETINIADINTNSNDNDIEISANGILNDDNTINKDYIGNWTDDTEGGNEISIYKISADKVYFDLGFYRGHLFEGLIANIIDNNTATFDTNDYENEYWHGIYGTLKFEDNKVSFILTKSTCEYMTTDYDYDFTCDHKIEHDY